MQPPNPPAMTSESSLASSSSLNDYCHLENLPSEIGLMIIHNLHPKAVKTLIRASPTYLALYFHNRPSIWRNQLRFLLGPVLFDAIAAVEIGEEWSVDEVATFLNASDAENRRVYDPKNLSIPETLRILHIHTEHIEPYIYEYANWALGNMDQFEGGRQAFTWEPHTIGDRWPPRPISQTMSNAEKSRLTNAIYRYLLLHRLAPHPRGLNFDLHKALQQRWAPWEWEGISSIFEAGMEMGSHSLFAARCQPSCDMDWIRDDDDATCILLLDGKCGLENVKGVEREPIAWGWTNASFLVPEPGPNEWDMEDWTVLWGATGYVFWDDDRMLRWARKTGRDEAENMGFMVGNLEEDPSKVKTNPSDENQDQKIIK